MADAEISPQTTKEAEATPRTGRRGRPRTRTYDEAESNESEGAQIVRVQSGKRGRPRTRPYDEDGNLIKPPAKKQGRGRPPKRASTSAADEESAEEAPLPQKASERKPVEHPAPSSSAQVPSQPKTQADQPDRKRGRGRPRMVRSEVSENVVTDVSARVIEESQNQNDDEDPLRQDEDSLSADELSA